MSSPGRNRTRLSPIQERIWSYWFLNPGTGSANVGRAWTLRGPVDPVALQRALDLVAARHDILRSQVMVDGGLPYLATVPERRLLCQITDIPQVDGAAAKDRALTFLKGECSRQFDFGTDPLVRIHLVRLSPDESILMILMPHLITDAASMLILAAELATLYSRVRSGEGTCLPAPLQFATFADWQRASYCGPEAENHLKFWRGLLTGAPASLELPQRDAMNGVQTSRYASGEAQFLLSGGLVDQLNAIRHKEGVMPHVVFLAAFAILLHQICHQEDIVFGGVFSGRVKPATRSTIGFLADVFALRFRFSEIATIRDAITVARNSVTNVYRHSGLHFSQAIDDLKGAQKLDPNFGLNAYIDYFPGPETKPNFQCVEVSPLRVHRNWAPGLRVKVWPEADGLAIFFEYQLAHFSEAEIKHVFALYEAILTELARSPGTELGRMKLPRHFPN